MKTAGQSDPMRGPLKGGSTPANGALTQSNIDAIKQGTKRHGSVSITESVIEYIKQLEAGVFQKLYSHPPTCLSIFRLVPGLGQQFIMRLLYRPQPTIQILELLSWCCPPSLELAKSSIQAMVDLHIFRTSSEGGKEYIKIDTHFRESMVNTLSGQSGKTFGVVDIGEKHTMDPDGLDTYAREKWEDLLYFMVGRSVDNTKSPPKGSLELLVRSGLMSGSDATESGLKITNRGFQFLLQDVNSQIWTLLFRYLEMSEEKLHMDLVEVLHFFFQLSSMQLGTSYALEGLTETQLRMLEDLRGFGIVYQRSRKSKRFFPTRLATTLTTPATSELAFLSSMNSGYIILETNYRIYAFTSSPLQIAILDLFVELRTRFPNMVAGMITRDSVRSALSSGITADQITAYLTAHAHPEMRGKLPILPLTVVDQVRLWEREKNRVSAYQGFLYQNFSRAEDFEVTAAYAEKIGALLWRSSGDDKRCMIAVSAEGHPHVREYVKRKLGKSGNTGGSNR